MKAEVKMNKQQRDVLAGYTCNILERNVDMEDYLAAHGIPKSLIDKMSKAMDLIYEVNQVCFNKKKK